MLKILVDCFGGDRSPQANVEGALAALQQFGDLHLILTGDEAAIRSCLEGASYDATRLEIVHAPVRQKGFSDAYIAGKLEGYMEGYEKGYEKGYTISRNKHINEGTVP